MNKIVFDIETSNTFQDIGSNNPASLDISVVGVYDYANDKYKAFLVEEFNKLWPIIENAQILITFNGDHFDIPLLNKYYPGDLLKLKSVDILKEMYKSAGRRMKLDQIAEGTLGANKSGHGLDAIKWWRNGEIEKVKRYCLNDVRLTKDIYEYALKESKLIFKEGPNLNEVKLDVSDWGKTPESATLNRTLPF
ncbi:MAG: ribonuclease H-like domain-containing protein [Candidatus Zambryskibacteria bacterium]|nr:ribonuclease H-like domain-containing protein [Candidatus Zambryskibacteria bacterium]